MSGCGICEASTDAFLCRHCAADLERDIGDMTSLLHEVSLLATRQTNVYRSNRPVESDHEQIREWEAEDWQPNPMLRTRDSRIALPATTMPINLDARDLLADAYDTLLAAACDIGADEISSKRVVAYLLTNADQIRFHPEAARLYDEITYIHRRMENAVDRSQDRIYAGPCHHQPDTADDDGGGRCERPLYALNRVFDEEWLIEQAAQGRPVTITCDGHRSDERGCKAIHDIADRRQWLAQSVVSALVTADELIAALPRLFPELPRPPRNVVNSWTRTKLTQHGANFVGEPLYLGADLLALVSNYRPKTAHTRKKRAA